MKSSVQLENDGLRNGKIRQNFLNGDAPEQIFFFCNLWKWYAPERKFRAENGGLFCGTYPICIWVRILNDVQLGPDMG